MSSEETRTELYKQIDQLLNKGVVNRHSYFQLKYFVVGKEPTLQSKMWRCIRELQARKESLDAMKMEMAETEDNIELAEIELERFERQLDEIKRTGSVGVAGVFGIDSPIDPQEQELNIREVNIRINKKQRQRVALQSSLASLERKRQETEEEAIYFLKAYESLQKVEPLKPYDDLQEQTKFWNEKIAQLANLKVLLHLPLDTELVQTALALSDECPIKQEVVKLLENERLTIEQGKKNNG